MVQIMLEANQQFISSASLTFLLPGYKKASGDDFGGYRGYKKI